MDTPLRERARSRDASWGEEMSGVRMARTGAVFCCLGALFGLLSAVVPDAEVRDQDLLVLVSVVTAALGMALFAAQERLPRQGFHAVVVAGTALAATAVYAWGIGSAYVPLPFLWVVLFAFYFFPLRAALAHMALVAVAYAIVLAAQDYSGTRVDGWVATVGTLTGGRGGGGPAPRPRVAAPSGASGGCRATIPSRSCSTGGDSRRSSTPSSSAPAAATHR